jgi:hypothetical protein
MNVHYQIYYSDIEKCQKRFHMERNRIKETEISSFTTDNIMKST